MCAWEVRPRQRQPQVREELYPERIPRGEQLGRSRQEVHRGREVSSRVRVVARGGEPLRRSVGERPRAVVERAELGAIPVRLLEVIPDDLVALAQRPRRLVEPRREPLVELRSGRLRDRRVRLVADQQVSEPERVGRGQVGALGADDLLADQRSDAIGCIRHFAREFADRGEVEDLPHHRCDLDQPAFRCGQLVQPRREQRRDRRWDGQVREIAGRRPSALLQDEPTLVDQEARDLLRVERVPLGGGGDALADHGIHRVIRQEVGDELPALLGVQRFEQDRRRVQLPPGPAGAIVEQLGARHAREQDRDVASQIRDVLDQLDERGLCPLDVVDHEDHGALGGEALEQRPDGPAHLFRGGLPAVEPDRLPDALRDRGRVAITAGEHREFAAGRLRRVVLAQVRDVDQGLGERVERDPFAVRQTPTAQDRRLGADIVGERRHQPRLAYPPDTEHREELARLVRHRSVEHVAQERELPSSSDDRGIEVSREPGRARHHLDQAVSRHRIGLPFHRQVRDRLGDDRVAHERERAFTEQDLARCRRLFQASRDVDGVAGDDLLVAGAGHHVARVHSDPAGQCHPVVAVQLRVQRIERQAHLARGANRAHRVVLVDLRHAEDGHDGVADVLLDGAPVVFDRRPHRLEVPLHDATDRLGVEGLAHRGGAGDVAEHDRDRFANLVLGRRC